MTGSVNGKRIAILLTNGVEQAELTEPRKALDQAGARTEIISHADSEIQAMNHREKGGTFKVDVPLSQARPEDYDALLLPGGVANPDELRVDPVAVRSCDGSSTMPSPLRPYATPPGCWLRPT